jgi:hypothetical protein
LWAAESQEEGEKETTQIINNVVSEIEVVTLFIPTPALGKILTYVHNKHTSPLPTHTYTHPPLTCLFKLSRERWMSSIGPPFYTHYGIW